MKFSILLPVVFCLGAQALPTAQTQVPNPTIPDTTMETAPPAHHANHQLAKRDTILAAIEDELDLLGLTGSNTIKQLLSSLDLKARKDDLDDLLSGLVGDNMRILKQVEIIVGDVLGGIGLPSLGDSIRSVEAALGLNAKDTIDELLEALDLD